jgi:FAD/FMN-containing dehydrogenase
MAATNAGGVHVLRFGSMRSQVVGIEAVLADGSIVERMDGLLKDNTGYDLAGLLCGSEGTLAILTALRLRLVPDPPERVTALLALPSLAAALTVLQALRPLPTLESVEVMFADGIDLVTRQTGIGWPLSSSTATPPPCALIVECAGAPGVVDALAAAVETTPFGNTDIAVAEDAAARAALWQVRERHTDAVNSLHQPPHKLDVTLPLGRIAEFENRIRDIVRGVAPNATTIIWGHLGDGNLHVNVVGPAPDDEAVDDAVLRAVIEHGGSISAEHGVGVAKTRWLALARQPADVAAMRAIKYALDPRGLLNPGVLFAAR